MDFGRQTVQCTKHQLKKRYLSQFYILLKVDGVISKSSFLERMQKLSKQVRSEPKLNKKKVMLPNDPELKYLILDYLREFQFLTNYFWNLKSCHRNIKLHFSLMDQDLVSIIIRTKNEERWISHCLESIHKQNLYKL